MLEPYFCISWFKIVLVWVAPFYMVETTKEFLVFAISSKVEKKPNGIRRGLCDKLLSSVHTDTNTH